MAVAEPYLAPPAPSRRLRARPHNPLAGSSVGAYIAFGAVFLIVVVTIFAHHLAPYNPNLPVADPLSKPGLHHLLGSDEVGRDMFSRILIGMSSSWWGAMIVIASGVGIGGLIGLVAGAAGGMIDGLLMRTTDLFLALPGAVLAVTVVAAIGPSYQHTLIAISIVWWPLYARIVRGEVTRLRASPHIEAARVAGAGRFRLAVRHLLPGAVPPTIIAATLDVGALVLVVAGLSFLGLGAPSPAPELGSMSEHGLTYVFDAWWIPVLPAAAVALLVIVANFAGDALRDRIQDR
jgi:peptide/nickel transport system permease protein